MYQYTVDYAQKNIWCTPRQDTQSVIAPLRVSPLGGVWINFFWQWEWLTLPTNDTTKYHLYAFGATRPADLGLPDSPGQWTRLSDVLQNRHLIVNIYSARGIQMPRYGVWYRVTENRSLIFAVQQFNQIPVNQNTEQLYFRFYRNAFYSSAAADPVKNYIQTGGQVVLNSADILAVQNTFIGVQNDIANGNRVAGAVYALVNGYQAGTISPFTVNPGDAVEWVYDSSIARIIDLPLKNLPTFTSTLDSKFKYLLHDATPGLNQIAYYDDNDIWLYQPVTQPNLWKGVLYYRNAVDAVRQITHRDYGIPVDYVDQIAASETELGWSDPTTLTIRIHIRKSGWNRMLVDEANRIHELYKLPDAQVVQALIGTNAVVPNWTAANLEQAAYPAVMGAKLAEITPELVQEALGYNAMSQILGNTPELLQNTSGQLTCQLPYGLTDNCTGYEFDSNGLLTAVTQHRNGTTYAATSATANLVEAIFGTGSQYLNDIEGAQSVTIDPSVDFRVYTCPIDSASKQPTYQWTDVTDTGQYAVVGTTLTMLTDPTTTYSLIRSLNYHLYYSMNIPLNRGVLEFTLTQHTLRNGNDVLIAMEIPMERLDIWVNNHRCVPGIDLIFNFPKVTIITSEYFVNPQTDNQKIDVRYAGLNRPDQLLHPVDDTGFVMWGRLSNNHRFDIRDDKVQSVQVGGATFRKSDLLFAESDPGNLNPVAINGQPYRVADLLVPMRNLVNVSTYAYRQGALSTDQAVTNYLSQKLPEVDPTGPSIIPKYWRLYSPFFSSILSDLMSGVLNPTYLKDRYTDAQVLATCQPYEAWLTFDPAKDGNQVDPDNAYVEPHPYGVVLSVNIYLYQFIQRVNQLYFQSRLDLSHYITITPLS